MRIVLGRHGDAANTKGKFHGLKDEPLTSSGRQEAYALAKELKQYHAEIIYYSPLSRCRDTAKILSTELGLPMKAAPPLKPLDSGKFVGKPIDSHIKEFKYYLNNPSEKIPGGQSVNDWAKQYLPFFEQYLRSKSKDTVIFVTHGRNIILSDAYMKKGNLAPDFDKHTLADNKKTTEHGGYAIADKNHFEIIDAKATVAGTS
jgi:broad specificity phosphatase PhoE